MRSKFDSIYSVPGYTGSMSNVYFYSLYFNASEQSNPKKSPP